MNSLRCGLSKKVAAEFIGTFALVFFGCGSIMLSEVHPQAMPPYMIAVVFGLVIAAMIYVIGKISGAHFNPAVTIAFATVKRFPKCEIIPYILGQIAGGIAAMAALVFTLPETQSFGETLPSIGTSQAFVWEFVMSFFLMFVIISVATNSKIVGIIAGAAIGTTVMLDAMVGGALTGASMNPARSLAPAIAAENFSHLWLYFAAPIFGMISAAFVYEKILCEEDNEKTEVKGCC